MSVTINKLHIYVEIQENRNLVSYRKTEGMFQLVIRKNEMYEHCIMQIEKMHNI
jgi:hypothetical protein